MSVTPRPRKLSDARQKNTGAGRRSTRSASRSTSASTSSTSSSAKASRAGGRGTEPSRSAKVTSRTAPEDAGPPMIEPRPEELLDFLRAVDDYKRKNRQPFPKLSDYLALLLGLGYRREAAD